METVTGKDAKAVRALVVVTVVAAFGCLLMAVAHAGIRVPVLTALGPGGDTAVPPAAAGFTVGALLYALMAWGLIRRQSWAWAAGLVINALVLVAAAYPFRPPGSVAGIAVSVAGLGLLLWAPVRRALLPH